MRYDLTAPALPRWPQLDGPRSPDPSGCCFAYVYMCVRVCVLYALYQGVVPATEMVDCTTHWLRNKEIASLLIAFDRHPGWFSGGSPLGPVVDTDDGQLAALKSPSALGRNPFPRPAGPPRTRRREPPPPPPRDPLTLRRLCAGGTGGDWPASSIDEAETRGWDGGALQPRPHQVPQGWLFLGEAQGR